MDKILAITIFLGSFISFALEPMIGRALLPVFGGTPTVWVTCLGVFQILMVGGYFYGEVYGAKCEVRSAKFWGRGAKCGVHIALLVLVGLWCCALSRFSSPVLNAVSSLTGIAPVDVFISVLVVVGAVFVLLSANATIVQNLSGGAYRLYAVSDLGAMLALFGSRLFVDSLCRLPHSSSHFAPRTSHFALS